jgi:hypothetical protein
MTYAEHSGHAHYVTARSDGRTALLAGPYDTRAEALALEDECRRIVREKFAHDMRATFAEIGTARISTGATRPPGGLNGLLGGDHAKD